MGERIEHHIDMHTPLETENFTEQVVFQQTLIFC